MGGPGECDYMANAKGTVKSPSLSSFDVMRSVHLGVLRGLHRMQAFCRPFHSAPLSQCLRLATRGNMVPAVHSALCTLPVIKTNTLTSWLNHCQVLRELSLSA